MSDATQAIDYVISWEGDQYVDNPGDPGGATKFGISLRFYQQAVDARATKDTIKNLTREQAVNVYHDKLWSRQPYGKLVSRPIANYLFDMAVNCGEHAAIQCAQRALWSCLGYDRPKDDGILGVITLNALNIAPACFIPSYRSMRAGYYYMLVAKNPMLQQFVNGWIRRAYQCYTLQAISLPSSANPPPSLVPS